MTKSTDATPKISVIIPTYCEAQNLLPLVNGVMGSFSKTRLTGNEIEIIVVDDNSPDDTKNICQSLADQYPAFKLITRTGERGLATAIKRGIDESSGDILVIMDADLSHDPSVIPGLLDQVISKGVDIAIGSRFIKGATMKSSLHSICGSKMLNTFIRVLLRIPVKDVTGGFFALRKDALNGLDMDSVFRGYGDYFFVLLYKGIRRGWKTKEIGFVYMTREKGLSKTKFLEAGLSYGIRALKLWFGNI